MTRRGIFKSFALGGTMSAVPSVEKPKSAIPLTLESPVINHVYVSDVPDPRAMSRAIAKILKAQRQDFSNFVG